MPNDALTAARFGLTVDGYEIASFSELAGITSQVDVVDYIETGTKESLFKKLPGKRKPPTIILTRQRSNDLRLFAWHRSSTRPGGSPDRKSCALTMYNVDGKPVKRYHLHHAWPSNLEVGGLRAGPSEVLMETVTMTCENIQRVSV